MKKAGALILSAALVASVFAGCSFYPNKKEFEDIYGPQLYGYLNHKYYFDGQEIPTTESNFYFINGFLDLSVYAGYGYFPATTMGNFDLAAEFAIENYTTCGEYFIDYSEYTMESTFILASRAQQEGITLPAETNASIDEMIENIKKDNPDTTVDKYLQIYYGPGMDEATFRKILERYYLADVYSKQYCDKYEFDDATKYVPYLRYALFMADEQADQTEKYKALEAATALKNGCKNLDDFKTLAEAAAQAGTVAETNDILVPKGKMVPKFEEWAYGENRKEGEIDIIYAPEYGYFVVGYLGLQEQDKESLDKIALDELSLSVYNEIEAKAHDFHTDDEYKPAHEAPTPTPIPGSPVSAGSMSTTDVLIVVLITLVAVAVLVGLVFLVMYSINKNNKNKIKGKNSSGKSGSNSKKNASSSKKSQSKPAKKKVEKKEEEEDEDEDGESDEDDE